MFKKALIVGLGVIGGSFAKAIRDNKISEKIFACDCDEESIELALAQNVIDGGFENIDLLDDEILSFDLIVIATPLGSYEEIFAAIKTAKSLIIDLGSIKDFSSFESFGDLENFVPCHPIAGSQNSGFENSKSDLFCDKKFIICKQNKIIEEVARRIGAKPEFLSPKKHDEIYALISHLPQFLSFLTKEFSPKNIKDDFFKSAFRLDDSSPEIWEDIFAMNEKNLEKFYVEFFDNLHSNMENYLALIPSGYTTSTRVAPHLVENPITYANEKYATCFNDSNQSKSGFEPLPKFDEEFFIENFSAIFFRAIIVKSYLQIPQIEKFASYAGEGFRDFTSISSILNFDSEKLANLAKQNQNKIRKIFHAIA